MRSCTPTVADHVSDAMSIRTQVNIVSTPIAVSFGIQLINRIRFQIRSQFSKDECKVKQAHIE